MRPQIVSYSCAKGEKFKLQKNKCFKGHNTAGYACNVAFSPDSKWVDVQLHHAVYMYGTYTLYDRKCYVAFSPGSK